MRFFGYFLSAQKVTRGTGAEPLGAIEQNSSSRRGKYFSPTRPAMAESEPIGAMRWHRRSVKGKEAAAAGGLPRIMDQIFAPSCFKTFAACRIS